MVNTLLRDIGKVYDTHIVKQQEVVTYVSPVEVFVNGIKFFNRQVLSVIALSLSSFTKVDFQSEQDCVTEIENLLCICKMQKHHAQNIETLCRNVMLKL